MNSASKSTRKNTKAAADPTNDPAAAEAIRAHFDGLNATLRSLEKQRADAEPKQLEALLQFAARAYRRSRAKGKSTAICCRGISCAVNVENYGSPGLGHSKMVEIGVGNRRPGDHCSDINL